MSELKEKFESVFEKNSAVQLKFPGHTVTNQPVFSRRYTDCAGMIILSTGNYCGLSHYVLSSNEDYGFDELKRKYAKNEEVLESLMHAESSLQEIYSQCKAPKEYILELVNQIRALEPESELGFVVFGGDPEHINLVKTAGKDLGIPMIGEFYTSEIKNIVVLPETHEAILYCRESGYKHWQL